MTFAQPLFLFGLILFIPSGLFLLWAHRRKETALTQLGNKELLQRLSENINWRGRRWQIGLWFIGLTFLIIALARPQWGSDVQVIEQKGLQILFGLDISPSMLAEDIKPNRLARAKIEIIDMMNTMSGNEMGLILFSGATFLQFPLTSDYATARAFIEEANPNLISNQGTDISGAIRLAMNSFSNKRSSQKVLILITDGEDHAKDTIETARKAAEQEILIFSIGLGSIEGAPIALREEQNQEPSGFLKNQKGDLVISRLDEPMLQQIAQITGGEYYRASPNGMEISALLAKINGLQKEELSTRFEIQRVERFQFFLIAALTTFILAEIIPERKSIPKHENSAEA